MKRLLKVDRWVMLLCGALMLPLSLSAQQSTDTWWFDARRYYDPLRAEIRAAQTLVLFPASSSAFEYAPNQDDRATVWDITMGMEIPIVGWQNNVNRHEEFKQGDFGIGLWLPIGFHMIEDVGDSDSSRPIINTDYRFAGMVKAQYRAWENSSVQAKISVGHESTHLGDEFALLAFRTDPDSFRRVNVSYEAWTYGISYQHFFGDDEHQLLVRHMGTAPYSEGYYSADLRETGNGTVEPPARKFEWGLGAELWSAASDTPWRPWLSIEFWNRIVYGYDRVPGAKEDTQPSVNIMVGTRTQDFDPNSSPLSFDIYVRYYRGVNPAGQFRNDAEYSLFGFGLLARVGAR